VNKEPIERMTNMQWKHTHKDGMLLLEKMNAVMKHAINVLSSGMLFNRARQYSRRWWNVVKEPIWVMLCQTCSENIIPEEYILLFCNDAMLLLIMLASSMLYKSAIIRHAIRLLSSVMLYATRHALNCYHQTCSKDLFLLQSTIIRHALKCYHQACFSGDIFCSHAHGPCEAYKSRNVREWMVVGGMFCQRVVSTTTSMPKKGAMSCPGIDRDGRGMQCDVEIKHALQKEALPVCYILNMQMITRRRRFLYFEKLYMFCIKSGLDSDIKISLIRNTV
jgi:hypothetical protein